MPQAVVEHGVSAGASSAGLVAAAAAAAARAAQLPLLWVADDINALTVFLWDGSAALVATAVLLLESARDFGQVVADEVMLFLK